MVDITNNKSFCVRLWTHLMFECNGDVTPCCIMQHRRKSTVLGNTKTTTLKEMWNSPLMKQYRKDMIEGKPVDVCVKCYDKEASGEKSSREHMNDFFKTQIDKAITDTESDGTYNDFNLIFWDVRFSNKCNFKCRMCGPLSSSAWVPDARKLTNDEKEIQKLAQHENIDGKSSLEYLKENASKVERIQFAGGEPLIMDEHYELLEHLITNNNFCTLTYHTNLSKLQYRDWNVIEMWKQWPRDKLTVWPSIDETGERAELLRCGTVWKDIEANLSTLIREGIKMRPNITVNAMNVNRIPELINYLYEAKVLSEESKYLNFTIGNVYIPYYVSIKVLPEEFKVKTKEKIINFIKEFKERTGCDLSSKLKLILNVLNEPQDIKLAQRFVEYTEKLDSIRGEDTYKVMPELLCIKESLTV